MADYPVSALLPEDYSSEEKQRAMANALRGQRNFAAIAQVTGDPVLSQLGQSQLQDAHQQQQAYQAQQQHQLTRAMEAQRAQAQQQYQQGELQARARAQDSEDAYRKQEVALRQAMLAQGKYGHLQGADGTIYKQDTRTGDITSVTGPTAKLAAPGKAGGGDLDKALKDLGMDLDPSGGRAGEFGKNQARVNAGKRVLQLVEGPQGYNLNPQQITELSSSVASLINSGGAATEGTIAHLTPKTVGGDAAKLQEWLLSEPTGAGQQAFVHQLVDTAKREVDVAQGGIREVQRSRLSRHAGLRANHPKEYGEVLKAYGLSDGDGTTGGAAPGRAGMPSRTSNGETRYWDGKAWVP